MAMMRGVGRCLQPLLLAVLALPAPGMAGQPRDLVGQVVDARSGALIAGATITIAGANGTVRTGADGRFTWERPPEPPLHLIVVLPGGQVAPPIELQHVSEAPAIIRIDPVAEESVTVIGTAPSVSASPAAATTLLSSTQITRRTPENLMQALETVPGVSSVSEGHASAPAIRGLARGRTLVLIDGARVTSERRMGSSATYADPTTFEGIDVARGPGSVAYGSDALGGVISIRTRRATPGSPLAIRAGGTVGAGIPEWRGTAELSKGLRRGGIFLQVHSRSADDWASPVDDGRVFNSGWKDRGVNGRFEHETGPGVVSLGWQSDFGREVERPRNNSQLVRFYYPYETSHRLTSSYQVVNRAGFQQLAFTGFVGTLDQRTDQDRVPTATSPRSIERADVSARDFHAKAHAVRPIHGVRLEAGLDVNGRFGLEATDAILRFDAAGDLTSETGTLSIDNARRTGAGTYVQAEAPIAPPVRVAAGVRGDYVATRNRGGFFGDRHTDHGAFSGFVSLIVRAHEALTVTGQLSRGFRDPTLSDRYFRGPSGRGFITGNPDLKPETSRQWDTGVRYTRARTQLAAYVYHYAIRDLVDRFATQPDFFFVRNQGHARLRGAELEARTEIGVGVAFEGGLHVARGRAGSARSHLDDIPADTVFLLARKDFGARGFAQVRVSVSAEDNRPGPSEVSVPSYRVVDAAGGWRLTRSLDVRAMVRNLFDEAYYASPDPRWVYAPGRSASLTLTLQFGLGRGQ